MMASAMAQAIASVMISTTAMTDPLAVNSAMVPGTT